MKNNKKLLCNYLIIINIHLILKFDEQNIFILIAYT